jgi:hypothetical protein
MISSNEKLEIFINSFNKVTKENLNNYLDEIVKYRLLKETQKHRAAFMEGFNSVFPLSVRISPLKNIFFYFIS